MNHLKTIVAIATPVGKSALAIIRLSGPEALSIVRRCVLEQEKFEKAPANSVCLYMLIDKKKIPLDEVTAIKYLRPKSFTGEDMVEIICHGGPIIVEEISSSLLAAGASPAGRGEFSLRAYQNGKIDLLKAEAIKGMIESLGVLDLACSRKLYLKGKKKFENIRNKLIEICATVDAGIEFDGEDDFDAKKEETYKKIKELLDILEKEIEKREKIRNVENFIQLVIAGPSNAGKSSLFNMLVGKERSIVHNEPGTTRDTVSEPMWICGYQVLIIDSAGVRETENEVEKEGIRRSREAIDRAAIIIWVTEADKSFSEDEINEISTLDADNTIGIINKIDLAEGKNKKEILNKFKIECIETSIKQKTNTDKIIEKIEEKLREIQKNIETPDFLLNKRQEDIGYLLKQQLCFARDAWGRDEIVANHLRTGISLFDEIIGKIDSEETLNTIFSSFCIGK